MVGVIDVQEDAVEHSARLCLRSPQRRLKAHKWNGGIIKLRSPVRSITSFVATPAL